MNVRQYINRIRNTEKRRYASDYARFMEGTGPCPDDSQYQLSTMGRQAVRMNLRDLFWNTSETRAATAARD